MNDDLEIKKLFNDFQPDMADGGEFMSALNKKLDAVEYVRAYEASRKRRYRTAALVALVSGLVLGGLLTAFFLLAPKTFGEFYLLLDSSVFVFAMTYKTQIILCGALILSACCSIPVLRRHSI